MKLAEVYIPSENVIEPNIENLSHMLGDSIKNMLEMAKEMPLPFAEMERISSVDEATKKLFVEVSRQCMEYLVSTAEYIRIINDDGIGSEEYANADMTKGRCHDVAIDTINRWSRSLVDAGQDVEFLRQITFRPSKDAPFNRAAYAKFAIALAISTILKQVDRSYF